MLFPCKPSVCKRINPALYWFGLCWLPRLLCRTLLWSRKWRIINLCRVVYRNFCIFFKNCIKIRTARQLVQYFALNRSRVIYILVMFWGLFDNPGQPCKFSAGMKYMNIFKLQTCNLFGFCDILFSTYNAMFEHKSRRQHVFLGKPVLEDLEYSKKKSFKSFLFLLQRVNQDLTLNIYNDISGIQKTVRLNFYQLDHRHGSV